MKTKTNLFTGFSIFVLLAGVAGECSAANTGKGTFHEADRPVTSVAQQYGQSGNNFIVQEKFKIRSGEKMSDAFNEWCQQSGWTLAWDAPEVISEADLDIGGNLESVVELVLDALGRGGTRLTATFYDANRVLRITEKK